LPFSFWFLKHNKTAELRPTKGANSLELFDKLTSIISRQDRSEVHIDKSNVSIDRYRWKSHCKELYQLPIAAWM
jgi:hypothetical protein